MRRYVRPQRVCYFLAILIRNGISILAILVSNNECFCTQVSNKVCFLDEAILADESIQNCL